MVKTKLDSPNQKKLFITGMGGMAGRALAKLALSKKYLVGGSIHENFPKELKSSSNLNLLSCYQLDLKKAGQIKSAFLDFQPDLVVHFAGKAMGRSDPQILNPEVYIENITIFQNLIKAIKNLTNRPKFILTSGCLVYDTLSSPGFKKEVCTLDLPEIDINKEPYRASRLDQEKLLIKEDLDYIIARPTQFTGPDKISGVIEWHIASQILKILKGQANEIILKNKLGEVDMLDVRDVANAYMFLIEKGSWGEIYHINSGLPVTVEKLAKVFLEVAGLNPKVIPIKSTDNEQTTYFRFSPDKINKLGWHSEISLSDMLLNYWSYFKTSQNF